MSTGRRRSFHIDLLARLERFQRSGRGTPDVGRHCRVMSKRKIEPELKPASKPRSRRPDEGTAEPRNGPPTAGPHARPDLTDPDKTPGTGMLPDPDDPNVQPSG
jgi:hypothetical protein